jgi:branched-chain amino acid transport system ATP-binding protein
MTTLLSLRNLQKYFRGVVATDCLDLDIEEGELHAIIGPNGAGKTTLINQISGELQSDSGSILFGHTDITNYSVQHRARMGISRSYQITSVVDDFSVLENVAVAILAHAPQKYGFWKRAHTDRELTAPAMSVLERFGLSHLSERRASEIAYGEQRQLELAMTIATKPKLLLLDEPMAGMSHAESRSMVEAIRTLKRSSGVLLIEHDIDAVFALADRISVLVNGRRIACGPPGEIRADPAVRTAYLGDEGLPGLDGCC